MEKLDLTKEITDYAALRETLAESNPVDIAEALEETQEPTTLKVFRMLPKDLAAEVFSYLPPDLQQQIVEAVTDKEMKSIIDEMFLDDAVDFIEEMPANVVKRVLAGASKEKRDLINSFLKYPDGSAGSIMTVEYVSLRPHYTVKEAFDRIRSTGVNKETIYTCYVTDPAKQLIGTVSVKDLLLASYEDLVGDIMDTNIISATTSEDKETLANEFAKYDLLAMPVVDHENRLVGIVTVDDAFEVQQDEATEDFSIMAAVSPSETPYLRTGVIQLTRNRVLWLMLLMLTATITGAIISSFEEALAVLPALVAFIPMLMDTGGNAGSQSSTLVIRGMALEEIELGDVLLVLWKEFRIALLCGTALSAVNFVRVMITNGRNVVLAGTVSISLFITVIISKSVGCMLPMGAKRLGLDPAVMASPVITTIVDACTLLVYLSLCKGFLGI
ncbi:MAG: magnesium transporter [Lachnospiraceae bacterium]|nr:magnesium transporter [Lachnospiraceae bacterium]